MKKYIIIVAILAAAGGGATWYFWPSKAAAATQVATAKAERGPLRVVVSSTGKVVSNLDVDIKCKASGEIIELPYDVSDPVLKDSLLMGLDPNDEQRSLRQANATLSASRAKLKIAEENLAIAERTLKTDSRKADSALLAAGIRDSDANAKSFRMKALRDKGLASPEEAETAATAYTQAANDLLSAQVKIEELKTQERALNLSRHQVDLARAQVQSDEIAVSIVQKRVDDCRVLAPMNGVISARNVQKGMIISSGISNVGGGTTAMTLSDLSRIFMLASVDESDIGRVRVGQDVRITADAYSGRTFIGKVSRIATRGVNLSNVVTFEVKIEVLGEEVRVRGEGEKVGGGASSTKPAGSGRSGEKKDGGEKKPRFVFKPLNPSSSPGAASKPMEVILEEMRIAGSPGRLLPEMTGNVEIIIEEKDSTLTVPVEAVNRKGGKRRVTVQKDDGSTEERDVATGLTDGNKMEILEGLSEGETVVMRKGASESRWNAGNNSPRMPGMGGMGGPPRR